MSTLRTAARLALRRRARQDFLWEWRRRLLGQPPLPEGPITRVLVVCHGNICRSPFLEAYLRHKAPQLAVLSAGLAAAADSRADPTARQVAEEFGLSLEAHRSRRLDSHDLARADLVLAMEGHQAVAILKLAPDARSRLCLAGDFLPTAPHRVPDPWGESEDRYRSVFARLALGAERMLLLPQINRDGLG